MSFQSSNNSPHSSSSNKSSPRYSNNFTHLHKTVHIRDPLYGMIEIPPLCAKFLDTPTFERLRNIRQLGLCYFVFPSATHTRFEHSLGTCHLAQLVCQQLHDQMSPREKELVCLAAMWHDVGHMSYSHLMDLYLEEHECNIVHEQRSIYALEKVNQDLNYPLSDNEIKMVTKMILGQTDKESKPFLFQIVSNAKYGVDVDRMDYLQRDAYHTGHPGFQPDYLIKCVIIKDNELAFKPKAKEELRNMFETRRRLFSIIYHHKTTLKIDVLIKQAICQTIQVKDLINNWEKWDDYELTCLLRQNCPEIFQRIARRDWIGIEIEIPPEKKVVEYLENLNF